MAFAGPTEAGAMEMLRKPRPITAIASSGLPAISPHSVSGTACLLAALHDHAQRLECRRVERIEPVGDPLIAAVGGEQELQEIVRADRGEIGKRQQAVELIQQRRHLDHRADQHLLRLGAAVLGEQ